MTFKSYWQSLSTDERETLADRLGVAAGHLRNIAYETRTCSEGLAIRIENATDKKVSAKELRPDSDWRLLRTGA